ncbi:MAG TPA: ATP-dependent DNA helicase DinG [Dongiaceae bacterium]|nr:ATP-dependent DNA helicase DinG [Dongiaceae bacterium]
MLSDTLKQQIQRGYSEFLNRKQLKPRYGQRLMIAEIAKALAGIRADAEGKRTGDNHVCVVEAGTGTGKTLAYLISVMPVAKALEKKVVLSTATVALQDQVVNKDIPELLRNSDISFTYALAKGRGRYLCLNKLDRLMTPGSDVGSTLALWEDLHQYAVDKHEAELYRAMDKAIETRTWDGDRDSWPDGVDDLTWRRVTNDHRGCTGRNCGFYDDCPFYFARNDIYRSDLIVANHDLVLADLAMGGGMVLPAPEDTIYIFDEGHHLPDKALSHFSCSTQIRSTQSWLGELVKMVESLSQTAGSDSVAAAVLANLQALTDDLAEQLGLLLSSLSPLAEQTEHVEADQGRLIYRFANGKVPVELQDQAAQLEPMTVTVVKQLQLLVDWLQEGMEGKRSDISKPDAEGWMPVIATQLARAQAVLLVWQRYRNEDDANAAPVARWLSFSDSGAGLDVELSACPVLASDVLARYLWNRAFAAIVTSATLMALGNFERFRFRSGVPATSGFFAVPSPFDYALAGKIRVPKQACDPSDGSRHTRAILEYLERSWRTVPGTLVLFSSRRQMEDVFDQLSADLQGDVLVQGKLGKGEIVRRHKAAVDDGHASVIFGLASFAEGIDLPGEYCSRVVIARLPFSVPEDPVDATLAEWIQKRGGNPFMQISVPDAAIKLKQAVGRLLRTETDRGEIVIMDRRLIDKRYGKLLLDSLPPFPLVRD